ncbi:MAG: glutamate--tRNA ligase [Candidatus Hadarchaeum sp.]|uniref:glutamate--tRNA ligase n=1 Tax=Candidatus Hadarchaeum sp. TaxID=2883567 RepID=UPI003D0FD81F
MEDVKRTVLRWALANAAEHGGKASPKAVLGKILAELPGWKSRIAELSIIVDQIVDEVNRMGPEEQQFQIKKVGLPEKKAAERRGLPDLPDLQEYGTVVTRFAPNPNGPLHIGHIRAALLSHEYARRYKGRFILRFEDTNPENAMLEMYEFIKRDLRWLGLSWDEEYYQSDRVDIYYSHAEDLIKNGKAYVCACDVANFRKLRDSGKPCPCRDLPASENLARWRKMLAGGYEEGAAVVRIKTDLSHLNPAVRDWPALRIVKRPHPRVGSKYFVWPLYNFSAGIDDHLMGITHIIRGKEHEVNEERQRFMYRHFGWRYPTAVQYGRLSMPGVELSKTQTMQMIRSGSLSGFDDVRLATIAALRRRGFLPDTIRQMIFDIGLTPVDSSLSWETLYAYNRKVLDPIAGRYFFVARPAKLLVRGAPKLKEVRLRLHPSRPELGERVLPLGTENGDMVFYISGEDAKDLKVGDIFRLKDLMNVRLEKPGPVLEASFQSLEVMDVLKFQWVSAGAVELEVIKPDATVETGLAEPSVAALKVGDIVQLERYGFVRIDSTAPKLTAVYAHR